MLFPAKTLIVTVLAMYVLAAACNIGKLVICLQLNNANLIFLD